MKSTKENIHDNDFHKKSTFHITKITMFFILSNLKRNSVLSNHDVAQYITAQTAPLTFLLNL